MFAITVPSDICAQYWNIERVNYSSNKIDKLNYRNRHLNFHAATK